MHRGGTEPPDFSLRTGAEQPRYSSDVGRYGSAGLECDCNRDSEGAASQPIYVRAGKSGRAGRGKMGLQNRFPWNRILGHMLGALRIKGNT
jgi:hypothetical protein